ncbi:MAG: hypothetical protein Q4E35_02100 [Eubacteriales bacterium]|nr:hypothetical protein [Eubacteriales bacterium]
MRKRIICSVVFVIMVFCSVLISPAAAADEYPVGNDCTKYYLMPYEIQSGDILTNIYSCWGLDYRDFGDAIQSINQLSSLDIVPLGVVLWLPTTKSNLLNDTYIQVISHVISYGDTAISICASYGRTFEECEKWMAVLNRGMDFTALSVGEEILIPIR